MQYSRQSLIKIGKLGENDVVEIKKYRGEHNRLGFAYQLIYIKLFMQLPANEVNNEILDYAAAQLAINIESFEQYSRVKKTMLRHQAQIIKYLGLVQYSKFNDSLLQEYIFNEALCIESKSVLTVKSIQFLKQHNVLLPAISTLDRLIVKQRILAREHIFESSNVRLTADMKQQLENLLVKFSNSSYLDYIKRPPQYASVKAIKNLCERLSLIKATGILEVELDINNNYQKIFTREIKNYSITRIRELSPIYRHTALVCFLQQSYQDITDYLIDTYIKLINKAYSKSKGEADKDLALQEDQIKHSLNNYKDMKLVVLDKEVKDIELRGVLLDKFADEFDSDLDFIKKSKAVRIFDNMKRRHNYFRKFSKLVFDNLDFKLTSPEKSDIMDAISVLRLLNQSKKSNLSDDAPTKFIPKNLQDEIFVDGKISSVSWETALLMSVKQAVNHNNIYIGDSKRFCHFNDFFMPVPDWKKIMPDFFSRTPLPQINVREYLTHRLGEAYDSYLAFGENKYAKVVNNKWSLSTDSAFCLSSEEEAELAALEKWLAGKMRKIKLANLMVEVDNDLKFTDCFIRPGKGNKQNDICNIILTIIAHGCNIGLYVMSQLVDDVTYEEMKSITDWQLNDDAHRQALSWIVNAISRLDISKNWGDGTTSSSDSHLLTYHQKVLQQNYSPRFGDYALAFYTFVADNYAPYYSRPIECSEGEAPYALDGILYHESELALEEHYTDTRAAATILYTPFEFLGKKFNPRIRGIQNHHIYKIDKSRNYGELEPMLKHRDSQVNMDLIEDQWFDMARFYGSIFGGHITASIAIKRLLALSPSNDFYKANLHLGRIFKTENTLLDMIKPERRRHKQRGLLKGEEMHQLARQVSYGKSGEITSRDLIAQYNSCNCLTLIMSCIIYWQCKEMARVIKENQDEAKQYNLLLIEHISPATWGNLVLYGEYIIDRSKVRK